MTVSTPMENVPGKSLQNYIDETPPRPLSAMQWRIWAAAAMGKFFEGIVVFTTGVALPLIEKDFGLSSDLKGSVAAASLFGILIGASLFGNLADRLGRKLVFVVEMMLFSLFIALTAVAWSPGTLIFFLFCVGISLGADYPTAHLVVSEAIPSRYRGRMVLSAFSFQSLGSLGGVLLGLAILDIDPQIQSWHWMYGILVIPGILVTLLRMTLPESSHWLMARERWGEANCSASLLLKRPVRISALPQSGQKDGKQRKKNFLDLFSPRYFRATILTAVPWFLQDLSTYGIGIFTPTILATLFTQSSPDLITQDLNATAGASVIDIFLVVGFLVSIPLVDIMGRISLQIIGFIGCAVGLSIAALSTNVPPTHELKTLLIFGGFMIFNFMNNLGPNAMTYVLAGEVFPTEIRGAGAGFAASFAKVGAVITAFFFPVLQQQIGTNNLLYCLAVAAMLGALITFIFRIETNGKTLDDVGQGQRSNLA
ncbi:MFS transporter [Synechocystis salina]|nr:MFS transporter [Synechocystis salina]